MFEVLSIEVLNNPCKFTDPFQFKINFECNENVNNQEFEWKIIYVGSAASEEFDQTLLHSFYGPFSIGQHSILLCSKPPNKDEIPSGEIIGSTVVLVVGRYLSKYFQVGYFVSNGYPEDIDLKLDAECNKLQRTVVQDSPRILTFEAGGTDDWKYLDLTNLFKPFLAENSAS